ncbi:hypothetical protein [[Phormidium] sp. ETS-05]|nr:hypothetical protein [[Phormidium] sp. ETS-05]
MSKIQQIKIDAPEDFSVKLAMSLGRDVSWVEERNPTPEPENHPRGD